MAWSAQDSDGMAPFSGERKTGAIKDHCLLCSTPVYEAEVGVRFQGVWVHLSCYRSELDYQKSAAPDRDAATPPAASEDAP